MTMPTSDQQKCMSKKRVLVIADTHIPWEHPDYLEFCKEAYDEYKCDKVVHIGDLVDAYGFSAYEKSPDSISTNQELSLVEEKLKEWSKVFKNVTVTTGNHTHRAVRKLVGSGLPRRLWPSYNEIFSVPKTWKFVPEVEIDKVLYTHGEKGDARKICLNNQMSTVSGHFHTKMGIEYYTNHHGKKIWGMQVGTGIDFDAYVFDYARNHKTPQLGAGIVIEGTQPIIVPFNN